MEFYIHIDAVSFYFPFSFTHTEVLSAATTDDFRYDDVQDS